MKLIIKSTFVLLLTLFIWGCEDDLEVPPQNNLTDETFWSDANNLRAFSFAFYTHFFQGYGQSYTWGNYFSGSTLNDTFAPSSPARFPVAVPTSGGGWSFAYVRKANIMIDRTSQMDIDEDVKNHWLGVGRLFRALEYYQLVNRFGDVPWFDHELTENDPELYRTRDDRAFVMEKVMEDLQFAADNMFVNVEKNGVEVNKYVALAFMSKIMLFEGTWQKYHEGDNAQAKVFLEAAKWAADEVIASGAFSLGDYRSVFNSLDLGGNPEVILYRSYVDGEVTHSLHSYVNGEPQTGANKNFFEAYLIKNDGLPISLSSFYPGDEGIGELMANRDPRMHETFVTDELRLKNIVSNYSTTGVSVHKFFNEEIADDVVGGSNRNITDAPIIRYGEVLMNYIEAVAELATVGGPALTQADLDKSINVLRDRPGIGMPHLEVQGTSPAVNGTTYDDPERDPTVPSLIWEIRRERRIELAMEGLRYDDLRRWKKLEYADMVENPDITLGAWIDRADHPGTDVILTNGDTGYIEPTDAVRTVEDKHYLYPLPLDQITLYADQGVTLEQNPGW